MKRIISHLITKIIRNLPFSKLVKMKIERRYRMFKDKIKKCSASYYPLVMTNISYGDEFLLKRYSGFNGYIYAVIEHGLYLGRNSSRIEDERDDYDLKNIITLSDYRTETIKDAFPGYHCLAVGPMIHYAQINGEFQEYIEKKKKPGKALLYFPVHGTGCVSPRYNKSNTFQKIVNIAKNHKCVNIIVCVYRGYRDNVAEINEYLAYEKSSDDINVIVTDCGLKTDEKFLDRLKTLIQLCDYAASNALGTNLGYCIYLNKPYYLLSDDVTYLGADKMLKREFGDESRSSNWQSDYEKEKSIFNQMFSDTSIEKVTDEQQKLCSYYWGYNHVMAPEDLLKELETIAEYARPMLHAKTSSHGL